jgi:hypothetical protein
MPNSHVNEQEEIWGKWFHKVAFPSPYASTPPAVCTHFSSSGALGMTLLSEAVTTSKFALRGVQVQSRWGVITQDNRV